MSTPLLPQSFWFRLGFPCRRVDGLPRTRGARLLGLPPECRLAEPTRLDGREPWAEVRAAWNPEGLAIEVLAEGTLAVDDVEDRVDDAQLVRFWVDTRDTRNVSRATRFCHAFEVRFVRGRGKSRSSALATIRQKAIARAVADAPVASPDDLSARVESLATRWRLEVFLPARALNGFDPEVNRRLGFMYQLTDPLREPLILGAGREFPVGENPGLWATLELVSP
ncbi:MAG: hypothetical protein U0794_05095 [Isosphaeraceae bacterium]